MHKEIENLDAPNETKLKLVNLIGEYNFRLVEGANEKIQLDALVAQMAMI
jgi:replication factor C small subunit